MKGRSEFEVRRMLAGIGSRAVLKRTLAMLVAVGGVSALAVVVTLSVVKDRTPPAWTPREHLSPATNDAYSRMLNEIKPKRAVSREDVEYVVSCVASDEMPIRSMAFSLAFELDRDGQVQDAASRELIRDCYLAMLTYGEWEYRAGAIRFLHQLGWTTDPDVRRRIEPLRDDPNELVVEEVVKALGAP